jgi:hypothetical protein
MSAFWAAAGIDEEAMMAQVASATPVALTLVDLKYISGPQLSVTLITFIRYLEESGVDTGISTSF